MDATADAKASSGIEDESAHDWVFDLVMTFFRSPEWDDRVMGFVDTHCNIFVNDEENKFEYTDVHDQFREHVERVITTELTTVGVSLEQFVEACEGPLPCIVLFIEGAPTSPPPPVYPVRPCR